MIMDYKEKVIALLNSQELSKEQKEKLENIFPGLQENENEDKDEMIRKELIEHIKANKEADYVLFKKFSPDDVIAWLEKQDFHYSFEIKEGHWYKCVCDYILNGSHLMFKNDRLYYCRRNWRLEGEIDERNVKNIGVNGYKSFFRPATNQEIKDWLEKQGEKKHADKVEPKFKIRDFIVNDYCKGKVIEITNDAYLLDTGQGIPFSCEHNAHLWTIQDAEDGDVLVEDSCIFIIQKLCDNSTAAKTYCTLHIDGDFDDGSILYFDIDSTKPATQEQRDLLFQAMKEAGYEWDSKKKELKKI